MNQVIFISYKLDSLLFSIQAEAMIDDIKASTEKVLGRTDWMDNATKARAIQKV